MIQTQVRLYHSQNKKQPEGTLTITMNALSKFTGNEGNNSSGFIIVDDGEQEDEEAIKMFTMSTKLGNRTPSFASSTLRTIAAAPRSMQASTSSSALSIGIATDKGAKRSLKDTLKAPTTGNESTTQQQFEGLKISSSSSSGALSSLGNKASKKLDCKLSDFEFLETLGKLLLFYFILMK